MVVVLSTQRTAGSLNFLITCRHPGEYLRTSTVGIVMFGIRAQCCLKKSDWWGLFIAKISAAGYAHTHVGGYNFTLSKKITISQCFPEFSLAFICYPTHINIAKSKLLLSFVDWFVCMSLHHFHFVVAFIVTKFFLLESKNQSGSYCSVNPGISFFFLSFFLFFFFVMQVPDLSFDCWGIHFKDGYLGQTIAGQALAKSPGIEAPLC